MKKFILAAGIMTAFVAVAPAVHAAGYFDGNGQYVFGYNRNYKAAPTAEQIDVKDAAYPIESISDIFGNTRIYDFLKAIKPSDVKAFLQIVKRAGIHY